MIKKKSFIVLIFIFIIACGSPTKNTGPIINSGPRNEPPKSTTTTTIEPKIVKPAIPDGAVIGNYNGDLKPFYARVTKVNTRKGITTIGFENKHIPNVKIPESYGATLSPLVLDGFDRDLLLITAKLKDPNFNKYFLFVLRDKHWKPVMNGFSIHKSNNPEKLQVIRVNPEKPNELFRYYSVFDMDENSDSGYTWRLLEESIVKQNW